jgi:hypothetical protein
MGWFGRLDDEELQQRLRQRYAENRAKEVIRSGMREEITAYLHKEMGKLCQALACSATSFQLFGFDDMGERKETWRQYMHNGKTDSVSGFLLDDATEEERRECLMYKSGETVNLKPFSAQLEQQFTREVLPRLQMQQNSVTQELDNITQLLDDIAVLHQQHITSAPLSR